MEEKNLDALIIPHQDEYLSEYLPPQNERLHWATGFTGSAGIAIVGKDKASIFVDGRYTVQVQEQVEALVSAYFNNFPAAGFVSHEEIMANPDFEDVAWQQNPAALEMARKTLEYTNFSGVDAHEELLHIDDALEVALKIQQQGEEE